MKTLLFIGVLVAVISWSSALTCWGDSLIEICLFAGKTFDSACEKGCEKCEKVECPSGACERITENNFIEETTFLSCALVKNAEEGCTVVKILGLETTTCQCHTTLCNGADGTSYNHLIIAFIVGAIILH